MIEVARASLRSLPSYWLFSWRGGSTYLFKHARMWKIQQPKLVFQHYQHLRSEPKTDGRIYRLWIKLPITNQLVPAHDFLLESLGGVIRGSRTKSEMRKDLRCNVHSAFPSFKFDSPDKKLVHSAIRAAPLLTATLWQKVQGSTVRSLIF